MSLNEFADQTQEEFRAKYLTLNIDKYIEQDNIRYINEQIQEEEEVNWVKAGQIQEIKNQGKCGSCWAFSAISAIEHLYTQKYSEKRSFSEQQLVDCNFDEGNQGCSGGWMIPAFKHVQKKGIQLEAEYPYVARDKRCSHQAAKAAFNISGYATVPPKNLDQLHAAVAQQVVSVALEVDFNFQFYQSGVYTNKLDDCGDSLNHAVSIVGYGYQGTQPYWLIRNSWGTNWGESGYIKVERTKGYGKGICGIALAASYPTL